MILNNTPENEAIMSNVDEIGEFRITLEKCLRTDGNVGLAFVQMLLDGTLGLLLGAAGDELDVVGGARGASGSGGSSL